MTIETQSFQEVNEIADKLFGPLESSLAKLLKLAEELSVVKPPKISDYCPIHNVPLEDLFGDGDKVCETCFEQASSHSEFTGTDDEDMDDELES